MMYENNNHSAKPLHSLIITLYHQIKKNKK
jgi:hypothetical protein